MSKYVCTIKSMSYDVYYGFAVVLDGFDHEQIQFIKPGNIQCGGNNKEITSLCVGGKIQFNYDTVPAVRDLGVVTLISDGIREVSTETGKLIKW